MRSARKRGREKAILKRCYYEIRGMRTGEGREGGLTGGDIGGVIFQDEGRARSLGKLRRGREFGGSFRHDGGKGLATSHGGSRAPTWVQEGCPERQGWPKCGCDSEMFKVARHSPGMGPGQLQGLASNLLRHNPWVLDDPPSKRKVKITFGEAWGRSRADHTRSPRALRSSLLLPSLLTPIDRTKFWAGHGGGAGAPTGRRSHHQGGHLDHSLFGHMRR